MNKFFENKYPFAFRYFSTLINQVKSKEKLFPQSIIFEGNDTKSQYLFTQELARILNCENSNDDNCNCINCRWIRSFSHPAVNNVSEIHFKGEDDKSTTLISVHQAKRIEKSLNVSSDYHRFFIFFSSSPYEYSANELKDFETLGYSTDIDYSVKPLSFKTYHPSTLNILLKSIEEPPKRTTFVFLTNSKENILQTVVSRSFVFKLNSNEQNKSYQDIYDIISDYPEFDYIQAFEISEKIQNLIKQSSSLTLEILLNQFIEYLKDLMLKNTDNNSLYNKLKKDADFINHAIKSSKANMSDKVVLENLMLKMVRGY